MKFIDVSVKPRRIVGVAADVDDENVVPGAAMTVYHPFEQEVFASRMFVHARTDPYGLVLPITKIIRELASDQPVERAATLDDVRAEVLAPNRLNALVFGGFAGVALTIAVVGVAGVLAFSVSARTREFGVRLAIGSAPRDLLTRVLGEGAVIAGAGIAAGVVAGIGLRRIGRKHFAVDRVECGEVVEARDVGRDRRHVGEIHRRRPQDLPDVGERLPRLRFDAARDQTAGDRVPPQMARYI